MAMRPAQHPQHRLESTHARGGGEIVINIATLEITKAEGMSRRDSAKVVEIVEENQRYLLARWRMEKSGCKQPFLTCEDDEVDLLTPTLPVRMIKLLLSPRTALRIDPAPVMLAAVKQ